MNTITAVAVFIIGASIGSFLSVVIHRMYTGQKGIIKSHSICPHCKQKLKWRHMIPVLSWLMLGGKCAYCGKKISPHYLFLEIAMGITFLATYLKWPFVETLQSPISPDFLDYQMNFINLEFFIFYATILTLMMAIFFYDLKYKEIPDKFSLPAIGIAIAGALIFKTPTLTSMLIGGLAIGGFFLAQFVLSKGKWIGGGDIRLGALIGLLLGWQLGLVALIAAYILGSLVSISLLATKKATRKTSIPFGPFLVAGTVIAIFHGQAILGWYMNLISI